MWLHDWKFGTERLAGMKTYPRILHLYLPLNSRVTFRLWPLLETVTTFLVLFIFVCAHSFTRVTFGHSSHGDGVEDENT
jgi:hypothetical protein